MAYRETDNVRQRKALTRQSISQAALTIVKEHGFRGLQMSAVARQASVATGTLYRYFPDKASLASHVFELATQTEVNRVEQALQQTPGNAPAKLDAALRIFSQRALASPTLAWALIAEPVDPLVDEQRLRYRLRYASLFMVIIEQGIAEGSIPVQSAQVSSTAIVGSIAESLTGPLSLHSTQRAASTEQLINDIVCFCLRALGSTEGGSNE